MSRRPADVGAVLKELGIDAQDCGGEWRARCPVHEDRNPSWAIIDDPSSSKHGLSKCWSCGFQGTIALLVMTVKGFVSWGSAYELLERFPAKVSALPTVRVAPSTSLSFRVPSEIVWAPLPGWPSPVRRYVVGRGITEQQVDRWQIGYAVDGSLAGRIVFPVHDARGVLCAYMARLIPGMGDGPRYLTPRALDRPDFDAVYGERFWPPTAERKDRRVVVWEGAIKALAFERAVPGEPFAVLGGSKLRAAHAGKLASFGEVVVATDKNRAGDDAAAVLGAILGRHTRVKRVMLPRDPDEMGESEVAEHFRS